MTRTGLLVAAHDERGRLVLLRAVATGSAANGDPLFTEELGTNIIEEIVDL
ncbi:hypothetical protein [Nocardia niigatensis]